ncbi:hypothetical protein O1L55_42350 [Streptomyces albulus]|nr:hypothetical protein [Streptomyces noursei]
MTPRTVDPAPLAGSWINFDTTATGIRLVGAGIDGGRLMLRITERGAPETAQEALTDGPSPAPSCPPSRWPTASTPPRPWPSSPRARSVPAGPSSAATSTAAC